MNWGKRLLLFLFVCLFAFLKVTAWIADKQSPGQAACEGAKWGRKWAGWRIKENIRKYNPCGLFSNLVVADAGDKCIWF